MVLRPEQREADDPQRAGDCAREAAESADHGHRDDRQRVLDAKERVVVTERLDRARQHGAPQSREEAAQRERRELRACRRHGERCRARFVLADADDRAADAGAAQVPDEEEDDDEGAEREVVVRAVVHRQVEGAQLAPVDLADARALRADEDRAGKDVDLRRDGEGHGADREQQAPHAQRAGADRGGDHAADGRAQEHREHERHPVHAAGAVDRRGEDDRAGDDAQRSGDRRDDADTSIATARESDSDRDGRDREEGEPPGHRKRANRAPRERDAADERRGAQRPEPRERGLTERQLPGPAGQHRDRYRDDRSRQDQCVGLLVRRLGDQERHDDRTRERDPRGEIRYAPHPPHLPQALGHRGHARREREAVAEGSGVGAADTGDENEHHQEEHELDQARRVREVVREYLVEDPDPDRAGGGARERRHATDERGGQAEQQRLGTDLDEVGRASLRRVEHERDAREETADRPDRGRHQLRADPGEAREIGVRRRRADGIAEHCATEEPPERERDDRHDDEREHLRSGDDDVRDLQMEATEVQVPE